MTDPWIHAGVVRSMNVSRRELRVAATPRCESLLEDALWVHVRLAASGDGRVEGVPLRCRVERIRWHKGMALVLLGGGVSRDDVARMKGAEVLLPAEVTPDEEEGTWTLQDLVGMAVRQVDVGEIGRIVDAFATGANDVIEVAMIRDDRTALLPMIDDLVVEVDSERRVVLVRDIAPYVVIDED